MPTRKSCIARTPSNGTAAKSSRPAIPRPAAISHKARSPTQRPSSIHSGIAIAAHQPHRGERELARVGVVEQIFEIIEHRLAEHGDGDDHRHHRGVERDERAVAREAQRARP